MNPEQWLSLKWNGGSTMSDRWLNQSKIIQGISQGITQGIAQGKIIGENATLQLVKILLANNKIQDIDKIYNDIQYRNKLMEEYKIYERI